MDMIPITEALKLIDENTPTLPIELVSIDEALGRILAEEIFADMDLPPFDRSQMDGFAVRSVDVASAPVRLRVIGESIAGKGFDGEVKEGEAVKIMTGARVPIGADAVQKIELAKTEDEFVEILKSVEPQENIVLQGEEIKKGTSVFCIGEQVTERMIPTLASFGYKQIKVYQRPIVLILSTGSELVEIDKKPMRDEIRNSNSIMLYSFLKKIGIEAEILPNLPDDKDALADLIAEKILSDDKQKLLITTGGVSVGDYDFTKTIFKQMGARIFFERVFLKPGKPTVFAKLDQSLIFGLPGNPVSAAVTFYLFVRRALLRMQGAVNVELRKGFAVVKERLKAARDRDAVLPVFVSTDERGRLVVESLKFAGSSNFIAFARSNALVHIPVKRDLEREEIAQVWFLD